MNKGHEVEEKSRTIRFKNGTKLTLNNVTRVTNDNTHLGITCDEGFVIVNPSEVLYHHIDGERQIL